VAVFVERIHFAGVTAPIAAIVARFSLIHVPPDEVADILRSWAARLRTGAPVLIAAQSSDVPGPAISFGATGLVVGIGETQIGAVLGPLAVAGIQLAAVGLAIALPRRGLSET